MIDSAEEFVRLRESSEPEDYRRAAEEPAPDTVWLDVIERFPAKREWVAHNRTIPRSIIEVLARDEDPGVRYRVAMKRSCPPELLRELASDPDATVRVRVAYNAKVPEDVLEILARDEESLVASAARDRIERPRHGR